MRSGRTVYRAGTATTAESWLFLCPAVYRRTRDVLSLLFARRSLAAASPGPLGEEKQETAVRLTLSTVVAVAIIGPVGAASGQGTQATFRMSWNGPVQNSV